MREALRLLEERDRVQALRLEELYGHSQRTRQRPGHSLGHGSN
jgi:hypothetical protein